MKRIHLVLAALCFALLSASRAHADTYFDFTFTGDDFSGTGVFDTVSLGSNEYRVQGVTGSVDGIAIIGLLPADTYPAILANDNLIRFGSSLSSVGSLDAFGVSFTLFNGADVNLKDILGLDLAVLSDKHCDDLELDSISIRPYGSISTDPPPAATPEPSSLALFATGLLATASLIRRRALASIRS